MNSRYENDRCRLRQWFSPIDKPIAVEPKSEADVKKLWTNNFLSEICVLCSSVAWQTCIVVYHKRNVRKSSCSHYLYKCNFWWYAKIWFFEVYFVSISNILFRRFIAYDLEQWLSTGVPRVFLRDVTHSLKFNDDQKRVGLSLLKFIKMWKNYKAWNLLSYITNRWVIISYQYHSL